MGLRRISTSSTNNHLLCCLLGVRSSDCDPGTMLSVSPGGASHPHLCTELWVSHCHKQRNQASTSRPQARAPRNVIYNTNTRASGVPDRFSASISGEQSHPHHHRGPARARRDAARRPGRRRWLLGAGSQQGRCPKCPCARRVGLYRQERVEVVPAPLWEGGSDPSPVPWFTTPCLFRISPRCVKVSKGPSLLMMGRGASGVFVSNIETQGPPTTSTTLLVQEF